MLGKPYLEISELLHAVGTGKGRSVNRTSRSVNFFMQSGQENDVGKPYLEISELLHAVGTGKGRSVNRTSRSVNFFLQSGQENDAR